MPITNHPMWATYVEKNVDPYGKACVDIAREVMNILDQNKDFDPHDILREAEKNIGDVGGVMGYMTGCIAHMVSNCHSRGEEFNDRWNAYYGVSKEVAKGGTVNPAILTINDGKA